MVAFARVVWIAMIACRITGVKIVKWRQIINRVGPRRAEPAR
jgi:hypothetical protein